MGNAVKFDGTDYINDPLPLFSEKRTARMSGQEG